MPHERRPSLYKAYELWYYSPFAALQGRNWVSTRKQSHAVHFNVCQQVLQRCSAGWKEGFTVKALAVNVTACKLILPARFTRKNMLLRKHVESFQPEENKLFHCLFGNKFDSKLHQAKTNAGTLFCFQQCNVFQNFFFIDQNIFRFWSIKETICQNYSY